MKIRYFSDLHLEYISPNNLYRIIKKIPLPLDNEICILAGDIGNPHHCSLNYQYFMKFINNTFKKSFVIAGNHEYYNSKKNIHETNTLLEQYFKEFENISFLNDTYEIYEDHCFIGTTLWSKITNPKYEINDMCFIPEFNYLKYNQLNMLCIDFLEDALEKNENCVVITHHLPSDSLINIKYKTQTYKNYQQWFYCDLDELIEKNHNKISCWIYGHTHTPSINMIYGKPFVCNPIGYPNENQEFDFRKCLEIE